MCMTNFNCNYISIFRLPYFEYAGGVISFTPEQFQAINGFSNVFSGWGGEDDNLRRRFVNLNRSNGLRREKTCSVTLCVSVKFITKNK